jgi:tetratricopeptide (TPR) repeat protein
MNEHTIYDIFLSYSHKDKKRVTDLARRLKQAGLRVWLDEWAIRPGDDIYLKVERGLEDSRILALCMSPAAFDSGWSSLERCTVLFRDPSNCSRRFVPILLEDCTIPAAIKRFSHIDMRKSIEEAVSKLVTLSRLEESPDVVGSPWSLLQNQIKQDFTNTGFTNEYVKDVTENYFIGRREELLKLSDFTQRSSIVCIYGQPGVGKTALASKWLLSESRKLERKALSVVITEHHTCEEIIAKLLLDLEEPRDFSSTEEKKEVLIEILSYAPILLLLDNCESLDEVESEKVEQLVIELSKVKCICILTSRRRFSNEHITGFELNSLCPTDAQKILKTRAISYDAHHLEDTDIERLCNAVGNLPLAIELLAPIIPSRPISDIIQSINVGHIDSMKRLITAFEISYNHLPSDETRRIFRSISIIPEDYSLEIVEKLFPFLEENISDILYELRSRCLVQLLHNNRYTMHTMTRTYALSKLQEAERKKVEESLIKLYTYIGNRADLWNVSQNEIESWQNKRSLFLCEFHNITLLIDTLIQRRDGKVVSLIIANADALTRVAKRGFLKEAIEKVLYTFSTTLTLRELSKLHAYLGSILHRQRNLDTAEMMFHKALKYSLHEDSNDWRFAGFSYIWLGWLWIENSKKEPNEEKRRQKAMELYKKAYDIAIEHNDNLIKFYALHHFGHHFHWKALKSSGNERIKLIEKARETYLKVTEGAKTFALPDRLCRAHSALAKLALNEGDYLTARYHARESEIVAQDINDERSDAIAKALYASCLLSEAQERRQSNFEAHADDLANEAKKIALEGLSLLQKLSDRGTSWQTYDKIGNISVFQREWEDAIWAYSHAIERYVTSSGSDDILHLHNNQTTSVSNQIRTYKQSYNEIRLAGSKGLRDSDTLNKNHQRMEFYDHIGLTLVWGLPVEDKIQEFIKSAVELIEDEQPNKFIARQTSCLHATILTMKKVKKDQSLTNAEEWPFGIEKALHDLVKILEIQVPFGVYFEGITVTPKGEFLLCGFPNDGGLSRIRGDIKRSRYWCPPPWRKGNFHVSLGYFKKSIIRIEEIDRLYKRLEKLDCKNVRGTIDRLRLVHFTNRSLSQNIGNVVLTLGKPNNLTAEQIIQFLHLSSI